MSDEEKPTGVIMTDHLLTREERDELLIAFAGYDGRVPFEILVKGTHLSFHIEYLSWHPHLNEETKHDYIYGVSPMALDWKRQKIDAPLFSEDAARQRIDDLRAEIDRLETWLIDRENAR